MKIILRPGRMIFLIDCGGLHNNIMITLFCVNSNVIMDTASPGHSLVAGHLTMYGQERP